MVTKTATNKKKILVTESMSQQGRQLFRERDDIELIEFPNMISAKDFEAMLKQQAPVHGVALGGTRLGDPVRRTGDGGIAGYAGRDPDRCRLRRRRCPGLEPPQGAADGGGHRQLSVG